MRLHFDLRPPTGWRSTRTTSLGFLEKEIWLFSQAARKKIQNLGIVGTKWWRLLKKKSTLIWELFFVVIGCRGVGGGRTHDLWFTRPTPYHLATTPGTSSHQQMATELHSFVKAVSTHCVLILFLDLQRNAICFQFWRENRRWEWVGANVVQINRAFAVFSHNNLSRCPVCRSSCKPFRSIRHHTTPQSGNVASVSGSEPFS